MPSQKPEAPIYSWMLRDDAEPLSDAVVDAFLDAGSEGDQSRTARIHRLFVQRLLRDLNPIPVRHVERHLSFGRWIEAIRSRVGLTRNDIEAAINGDAGVVERVEQADVPPWQLKPPAVADLICLFRLHISAVEQLFQRSQAVVKGHQTAAAAARSSASDLTTRGESARKALDLYLAASSKESAATGLPSGVMEGLTKELERRHAFELIAAVE